MHFAGSNPATGQKTRKCIYKISKNFRVERVKLRLCRSDITPFGPVMYCAKAQSDVMRSASSRAKRTSLAKQTSRPKGTSRSARAEHIVEKSTCLCKCFFLAGVAGFEPARCKSQSLVPYRLATPQYRPPQCITKLGVCQYFFEDFYSGYFP